MEGSEGEQRKSGARFARAAQLPRAAPIVLTPFSTRLPPDLLERLRVAAPQLELRQGDITAIALDGFLRKHGF